MSTERIKTKEEKIVTSILVISEVGIPLARTIAGEFTSVEIYAGGGGEGILPMSSVAETATGLFAQREALIFIGALGICIRAIAPYLRDKYTDPAVLCVDTTGRFVIPVLSGHVGGANELAKEVARIIGGEAVLTTQSDNAGLWALDTLADKYCWTLEPVEKKEMNEAVFAFVSGRKTALLLDTRDSGTEDLERTKPTHVTLFYDYGEIDFSDFDLFLAVTPFLYQPEGTRTLLYHPHVLTLGVGCRRDTDPSGIAGKIREEMQLHRLSPLALKALATIDLKKDEPLVDRLSSEFGVPVEIFTSQDLEGIEVPSASNPKVKEVTGSSSVSEATAIKAAGGGRLLLPKVKGKLSEGNDFTFAVAWDKKSDRTASGHIEILGAGPGDPELISVKGKRFLEGADLILYAGSLVPKELTRYAKEGATVRSSAGMNLEEQFAIMKDFYDRGLSIVRLHTGDPSIYGAIQEQMALFDAAGMDYHITPGISSFQAAAAELQSEFTIPEKVQTIILTRGEGRTAMPEREKLHLLARSRSTMCIYLSALLADEVQQELLTEYPPETPVAVCHKLTWKEQRIYRGTLDHLSSIIKDNGLKLTTLIVVGEAIGNRKGLSRLYADEFKHLFRK